VTPVNAEPVKFLKGTVTNVPLRDQDLEEERADTKHVLLLGAEEFSCSWNKQKVALNYRRFLARIVLTSPPT